MIKTLQFVWDLHKQLVFLSINCIKADSKSFLLVWTLSMIILEFLTMQGVIKKFLKPQRCCRNTAVAAMVQNSGLFSRSVPSDSSDMGQHLKSIPQGSMLGHVAATRLEHLLGLAVLQFLILPTPRCKDLKRQKHLQPQRVSKRKKVNHYLVGYICWLLSTFSLSSCCTFPHMRWQLALSFLFGTIFRHFSEQLTLTVPTPRYTMAARWEFSCWPVTY